MITLIRRSLPSMALAAIGVGAAGVLALWWRDTPGVRGAAGWLTCAGQITGLLAGYAAPVLLLLMARIPLLERELGADRLARWHARGGRYMVGLVLAHLLTITWGYALTDGRGLLAEGVRLVFDYPEMIKATLGTLLLLGVGAVSAAAARRRLSYELWYYLHLATYLAVALAFGHQLANGAQLSDGPGRPLWYLLYLGTAALICWYRFLVPFLRDRRHRLRVAEIRPEGPGVVSVFLRGRRLDELHAEAGQFFRLQFQTPGLRWAANPYSLSAPPHPNFLRFTVKSLGSHSAAVARLPLGTRVLAEGPYGAFTARRLTTDRTAPGLPARAVAATTRARVPAMAGGPGTAPAATAAHAASATRATPVRGRRRGGPPVLLLGAGVGITPLRALFETLPGQVTLVQRAHRAEDVLFREELAAVAAARGGRVHELLGSRAEVGDLGRALSRLVPGLARHEVFLCGPDALTAEAVRSLRAAGVRRIHHESFSF